ncbi:unnamed protein product, partial [Eretmochelys imbricata]
SAQGSWNQTDMCHENEAGSQDSWVLTPGMGGEWRLPACHVNLGERQLSNPSLSRVSSPVRQIVVHPNYNVGGGPSSADIALRSWRSQCDTPMKSSPSACQAPSDSFPGNHTCWVTSCRTTASA